MNNLGNSSYGNSWYRGRTPGRALTSS
jgi:hypothetical protein